MRIAFITTMASAFWGGSEALWAEAAHRAIDAGHEVLVSVYRWPTTPAPLARLIERGVRIDYRKVNRKWRRSGILTRLFYPFRTVEKFRPDAILINQGSTYDISRSGEFTRLRRSLIEGGLAPFVLLCHCEQKPPRHARATKRARQAFQAARIVGMLSNGLRERSEAHLGIPLPNVRLFQNPLNIAASATVPWPTGDTLRFAFVGRIDGVKGLDIPLQVFASNAWRARSWQFDIFGDGDLRSALEEQTRSLGLADRFRFRGFVSDIDAVWRDNHIFLLTSHAEGVPNSMLEAMLSGRPVVVADVGGISEWVRDGENGYLLRTTDVASLTDALERLWENRAGLEQMGRVAFKSTMAKRDPDPPLTLLRWLEDSARSKTNRT